jgi:phage terminase small subunit
VQEFARYCANLAEWRVCYEFIKAHGHEKVITAPDTGEILSCIPYPASKRMRDLDVLLRFEAENGMTPSSRSRIKATPPEEDELEKLITPRSQNP